MKLPSALMPIRLIVRIRVSMSQFSIRHFFVEYLSRSRCVPDSKGSEIFLKPA